MSSPSQQHEPIGRSAKNLVQWLAFGTVGSIALERLLGTAGCQHAIAAYQELPNWMPVAFVSCYYVMVHWHLHLRSAESKAHATKNANVPGAVVGQLLALWNMAMTGLSVLFVGGLFRGAARMIPNGFRSCACDGDVVFSDPAMAMWYLMFGMSKFVELIDTVFLVARGRDVPFLHWYHHVSVLLYCWLSMRLRCPTVPFGLMNAVVHSIMYYYYYCSARGVKVAFARYVTQIQLMQMAGGLLWSALSSGMLMLDSQCIPGAVCQGQWLGVMVASTVAMYASYFYLFYVFYQRRYKQLPKPEPKAD